MAKAKKRQEWLITDGQGGYWAGMRMGFGLFVPLAGGMCGEQPAAYKTKREAREVLRRLGRGLCLESR